MTSSVFVPAGPVPAAPSRAARLAALDGLRGVILISMILYHGAWDLVYLFRENWAWYRGPWGFLWQQSICWGFILLSGFCWPLGRRPLRRGLVTLAAGGAVTAVTLLFLPEQAIWFGVLTLLGCCMLLLIPLNRVLQKVLPGAGLAASALLFALLYRLGGGALVLGPWRLPLPQGLYRGYLGAFLGFTPAGFLSADYFPLLPWFFLFLAGYFLHGLVKGRLAILARWPGPRLFGFLGRHSLFIYLLHQPLLYGALCLCFGVPV